LCGSLRLPGGRLGCFLQFLTGSLQFRLGLFGCFCRFVAGLPFILLLLGIGLVIALNQTATGQAGGHCHAR